MVDQLMIWFSGVILGGFIGFFACYAWHYHRIGEYREEANMSQHLLRSACDCITGRMHGMSNQEFVKLLRDYMKSKGIVQ